MKRICAKSFLLIGLILSTRGLVSLSFAEETEKEKSKLGQETQDQVSRLDRMTVTGGALDIIEIPGSVQLLRDEDLRDALGGADDIHRALKTLPGVNVTDEEGFGLRPNIGLRGTSTERSAQITLMEDGVLIAPAPYAAPSAYYFPSSGRMEGLEVTKGPGQIRYGPRTTGGSLNLFSTSIPDDSRVFGSYKVGSFDTQVGHLSAGKSFTFGGFNIEGYRMDTSGFKDLDGGGDTGFLLEDVVGKFRINTGPDADYYQALELKLQRSNQVANETYLGLTEQDFQDTPFRRYAGSQRDRLDVNHDQISLTHYADFKLFDVSTTFYINQTKRNWYKLQSVDGTNISSILDSPDVFQNELSWIRGSDSPEDAFALRANNREYSARGVQTVVGGTVSTESADHTIEAGIRYHEDYEDRFQQEDGFTMINETLTQTSDGAPGSNANRRGEAESWAFFLQDTIQTDELTIIPGLRYESIQLARRDFGKENPERDPSGLTNSINSLGVLIPGVGMRYKVADNAGVSLGVHKGFSPPGPSSDSEIQEEESINYEAGFDISGKSGFIEVVAFLNDYENLLGADTASSGGEGTGDLFNAGESRTYGLEVGGEYNVASFWNAESYALPFTLAYTYTNAEFESDFDSELFGEVRSGDSIPYIPEHQAFVQLQLQQEKFDTAVRVQYTDAMPTIAGGSGIRGGPTTDSAVLFDTQLDYHLNEQVTLFGIVENVFDNEYVAARRPAGARPGRPRTFFAGARFEF